jgi:phage FluMu gp28-like protein
MLCAKIFWVSQAKRTTRVNKQERKKAKAPKRLTTPKQYALLPYQARVVGDRSDNRLVEKSRRIGISWALAAEAALTAASTLSAGGMDVIYVGYNKDMTRDFISDCAWWARKYQTGCSETTETIFEGATDADHERQILAYTISFASGFRILALSSKPTSLRGKHRALVILDEFAFHPDPDGLLKAATANAIWGGRLVVVSTHFGVDNPFNRLINDIAAGREDYSTHRITFDDALDAGLYERICLVTGKQPNNKEAWRANILKKCADNVDEELRCIPARSGGVYFARDIVERCMQGGQVFRLTLDRSFLQADANARKAQTLAWCSRLDYALADLAGKHTFFGMDFGRSSDRSVIVLGYLNADLTRRVPMVIELSNVPHETQEQILDYAIGKLRGLYHGAVDSTGNGEAIGEHAALRWGLSVVDQVKITSSWYATELPRLRKALEEQKIKMVADADHLGDFGQFIVVNGQPILPAAKRPSVDRKAPPRHGDAAIAYVLAYSASCATTEPAAYEGVKSSRWGDDRDSYRGNNVGSRWTDWSM